MIGGIQSWSHREAIVSARAAKASLQASLAEEQWKQRQALAGSQ